MTADAICAALAVFALGSIAYPQLVDICATTSSMNAISSMTGRLDQTDQTARREALAQAQAYNTRLAKGEGLPCNQGLAGGNGGTDDILELQGDIEDDELVAYNDQLQWNDTAALCWIDIPLLGVREPVYHGTAEEALASGVGHLDWSSLPVGGSTSHCVLAAHSGMDNQSMFDDIELLENGDCFDLHTLGDCYRYEVFDTEIATPEDAADSCGLVDGADLCTLVTCTPYGINTHRLLVHGRRVRYTPEEQAELPRLVGTMASKRRVAPLVQCAAGLAVVAGMRLAAAHVLAWHRGQMHGERR